MTTHAVIVDKSGRALSVVSLNSNEYWERTNQQEYQTLHTGSASDCKEYHEELAGEMVSNGFYE